MRALAQGRVVDLTDFAELLPDEKRWEAQGWYCSTLDLWPGDVVLLGPSPPTGHALEVRHAGDGVVSIFDCTMGTTLVSTPWRRVNEPEDS